MTPFNRPAVCVFVLTLDLLMGRVGWADVVAVVSAKSPLSTLTKNQVADIFLGKSIRFPDGTQAIPIDQEEGSPARDEFYIKFADKSPAQIKTHWTKIIFTGRGQPPKAVSNDIEVRKVLASNPHTIGYIERSAVDSSIRILVGY